MNFRSKVFGRQMKYFRVLLSDRKSKKQNKAKTKQHNKKEKKTWQKRQDPSNREPSPGWLHLLDTQEEEEVNYNGNSYHQRGKPLVYGITLSDSHLLLKSMGRLSLHSQGEILHEQFTTFKCLRAARGQLCFAKGERDELSFLQKEHLPFSSGSFHFS